MSKWIDQLNVEHMVKALQQRMSDAGKPVPDDDSARTLLYAISEKTEANDDDGIGLVHLNRQQRRQAKRELLNGEI